MDANQIEKLKALALAATPGPWEYFPKPKYNEHHVSLPVEGSGMRHALFDTGCDTQRPEADARFIAAANPAAVLELCNENADLRAEVERLRAEKDARVLHLTHERDFALRANRELATDAERFRLAIALEDNAESLYAAVLSHAPDANAIRADFDAAIGAHAKAETEPSAELNQASTRSCDKGNSA